MVNMVQKRKRANWLKYEMVKMIIRDAGCTSRKSYWDWWVKARPNNIPKMPERVYKEWTTWGEFLGNANVFGKEEHEVLRPYWEAVRWSQDVCRREGLTRSIDWLHYYDANDIPNDIPKNGNYHYKGDWQGWGTWLGTGLAEVLDSARSEVGVWGLCTLPYLSSNVVKLVLAKDGEVEFNELVRDDGYGIVAKYRYELAQVDNLEGVMRNWGTLQPDGMWVFSNIDGLLFDLDSVLLKIR